MTAALYCITERLNRHTSQPSQCSFLSTSAILPSSVLPSDPSKLIVSARQMHVCIRSEQVPQLLITDELHTLAGHRGQTEAYLKLRQD